MTVDCILKFWFKAKGDPDSRYYEMPIYEAKHYKDDFDTKWELQIVSVNENGEYGEVLKKVIIDHDKPNTTYYVSFNKLTYVYLTNLNQIFCSTTLLTI